MNEALSAVLEYSTVERVAIGFGSPERRLWHPDGFLYFVDLRRSRHLRWQSAKGGEVVCETTGGDLINHRSFASLPSPEESVQDGMKVDV
jgi:sugar lactone lactonase YvrE